MAQLAPIDAADYLLNALGVKRSATPLLLEMLKTPRRACTSPS